jgi:hypothetical protein
MPGAAVKIGPFTGGQNTYSDPTAIGDNEALEITNFDVDIDGSLVTRPPFYKEVNSPSNLAMRILGWFTWTDGTNYLIASRNDTGTASTYYYNLALGTWTAITTTFAATAMVQYQNKAWLVADPTSVNPGGNWDPTTGFTAVAAMKKGIAAIVYKERMFIGEGGNGSTASRLYFSAPATFTTWNSSDFLDVKAGDGQTIVDLIVYADTVVIFKEDSCYIYAYDTKPTSGQVRVISNNIGVAGKNCIIEYENSLYVFHDKNVYSVTNWNFQKLNIKVPFQYQNRKPASLRVPYSMSLVGDRLVVRYYDNYYVWGLKTRIWVQWKSDLPPLGKFWAVPQDSSTAVPPEYFATAQYSGDTVPETTAMYSFQEAYDPTRTETFNWALVTKTYDFESPYTYKRLFWWGVDVIAKGAFVAQVFPISYGRRITWDQAKLRTWAQAKSFTWDRGADIAINVDTNMNISGSSDRTFVKLLKSLRFRQVNFKLSGTSNGKSDSSPMRIFAITIFVDSKEKVVAQVT